VKFVIRFLSLLAILILFLLIVGRVFIESWLKSNITSALNKGFKHYTINIEKVQLSLLHSTIELKTINIFSKSDTGNYMNIKGDLASIKLKGINVFKVIFKRDVDISEITLSDGRIAGVLKKSIKERPPLISLINMRAGKILFDKIQIELTKDSSAQRYAVKEATFAVYDVQLLVKDTFTLDIAKKIDFKATELLSVSADSMYFYKGSNIAYSNAQKTLSLGNFTIHPNFSNYDFTSRNKYQTDCISAEFNDISIEGLDAPNCFSDNMVSSYIQIGKMNMKIFSDKRKPFDHHLRSLFPEMIYYYSGKLNVDSLLIKNGEITYVERDDGSPSAGSVRFTEINARIFNITNKPIYKIKDDSLKIIVKALLMGKGLLTVVLTNKIYDRNNALYVSGSLTGMNMKELNPFLEKTEFIHLISGKLNMLDFSFKANNYKATGNLILRYTGLVIAHMKRKKGLTSSLTEIIFNFIWNKKILNENPLPGKELRIGIIEYKRDPERLVINYLLKSVMSGIKSSIVKSPQKKNHSVKKIQKKNHFNHNIY
jgi:hypothetical protein